MTPSQEAKLIELRALCRAALDQADQLEQELRGTVPTIDTRPEPPPEVYEQLARRRARKRRRG